MRKSTKSEPRDSQFNLSLTASELTRIKERADAAGMRPVHFGRAILLDERSQPSPNSNAENHLLKLIYSQLIRLGNNLNQLVRHLHRHGGPLPRDLEPLLQDIRNLITRGASR